MKPRDRFVTVAFAMFAATALIAVRPAKAASTASDNACNSPYSGTSWSTGQNGGTGFGPWSLFQTGSGTSSFFAASAADTGNSCSSSGGINASCGESWGEFAGSGAIANALRTFTGTPNSLLTNQTFSFSIANGYVDTAGAVALALENSSSNIVWEFLYVGGNPGGYYSIYDGSGSNDVDIGYLTSGLVVVFTLTSTNTYSVTITPVGGSTTTATGTLQNPVGGQAISQFCFYNNEPSTGNGCNYNAFLNTISVTCPGFTVSAPTNQSVCVGNTASFSVSASGANTPSYQWQVSTNGGSAWNPVSTGTGGTTTNYTTAATMAGNNGAMFECAVTAACGNTVTSAVATLTVATTTSITTQPTPQTAYTGGSANFTVVASALSYQWYEGPTAGGVALSNGGSVNGATTATLTLSGLATNNSGANFYVVVSGCGTPQISTGATLTVLAVDPFLKANGRSIRNGHGNGDVVPLHGANFGAWLIMEGWMCPMDSSGLPDNYSVISELDSNFGVATEQSLIRTYQYNWVVTNDLDKIRALGMNLVRVPFWWGDVETLSGAWRTDAFDRMDWVVSNAWQRGIYTILDFHGVPGGQSTSQDTGQENQNAYWTNAADQVATAMIWSNIAAHYVGNPAVAAYDLMNEPSGAPTQLAIWYMYTNLYQVVRSVDPDHICLMEGCWSGTGTNGASLNWQWDVLPPPSMFGWSNVVYSMHSYAGSTGAVTNEVRKQTGDFASHYSWNVPDYIGEFQAYGAGSCWQYTITNYDAYGINWSTWTYKATAGTVPNSWGIYDPNSNGTPPTPNIQTSTSATISNDWAQSQTTEGFGVVSFEQQYLGGPLAVANSYTATSGVTLVVGTGAGVLANAIDINAGRSGIQLQAVLVNSPANGVLTLNTNGAFSYAPNAGFIGADTFRYQVYDGWQLSVDIATAVIQVNPPPAPPAPTGLTAVAGDGVVMLSWNAVSAASSYNVIRGTTEGGPYTTTNGVAGETGTNYTDTSVSDGTTYYYVVTAVDAGGQSGDSNEAEALPLSAYQQWQVAYFGSTTNPLAAPNADPYGKGISNTNQFLLGLNPTNPASVFQILSVVPQGIDMGIRWAAAGIRTNVVQAGSGDASGDYTANFADISGPIIITPSGDTTTNYTDSGGATNGPARYYRIRLVP
ncbi:MAG: cellulase family glycosylhydrolase [Verrucomicrobiia bacterium]|jgi:aryl-phospho-beta-D-glucosidase BglC (GH1 family)